MHWYNYSGYTTHPSIHNSLEMVRRYFVSSRGFVQCQRNWVLRRSILRWTIILIKKKLRNLHERTSLIPFTASLQNCILILPIIGLDTLSCTIASSTFTNIESQWSPSTIKESSHWESLNSKKTALCLSRIKVGCQERVIVIFPNEIFAICVWIHRSSRSVRRCSPRYSQPRRLKFADGPAMQSRPSFKCWSEVH